MPKWERSFTGRSAIVTGGGSGIGRAIGARLHALGAHVVLADLDGEAARAAASEIAIGPGGSVVGAQLDVRDRPAVRALVSEVAGRHGGLDLLFNNAGISVGGPSEQMPDEHWDRAVEVNLGGVVNGVIAALPLMVAQGRGHIVNTASAAGLLPAPFVAAYSATKHAVVGLSGALRPEVAPHGVRVTVLCPGMVETPILDGGPPADLPPGSGVTLTARTYLETVGMKPITADQMARIALRGVARNRAVVVAPAAIRVGLVAARVPGAVTLVNRRAVRLVRRAMADC